MTAIGLDRTLATYLDDLASNAPTPGGGSVSGIVAALAMALGQMVIALSESSDELAAANDALAAARARASDLSHADEVAYGGYIAAAKLPKSTPDEKAARRAAMQAALRDAAETPMALAELVASMKPVIDRVAAIGNPHVVSDAAIARILADAAIAASLVNVRVNIPYLKDERIVRHLEARIEAVQA